MTDRDSSELTRLLQAARDGESSALNDLFDRVYGELRAMAGRHLGREAIPGSLQPTALLHEAYLRLVPDSDASSLEGRRIFFGAASRAMRRILVERARHRLSEKGGAGQRPVTFHELGVDAEEDDVGVIELDRVLSALAERSPDLAEIVRLRYFAGLNNDQIAAQLNTSVSTVSRQWRFARAWLFERMESEPEDS